MKPCLLPLVASVAAVTLLAYSTPATAQLTVWDPTNHAQNVLQAARALTQVNNQIKSIQNEAQMLLNQGRNLASLPYSSLQKLQTSVARTQQLLGQAKRIAYDVRQIDRAFATTYAPATADASAQSLLASARKRWETSVDALQDSLKLQAGVVANIGTTRAELQALVTSSQSATGALQVAQAGNQILALQAQQLTDLTAVLASQGRASNLESAQRAAAQDQGRERLRRFLAPGSRRQSTSVTMFHDR